jgi:hypothetical protein
VCLSCTYTFVFFSSCWCQAHTISQCAVRSTVIDLFLFLRALCTATYCEQPDAKRHMTPDRMMKMAARYRDAYAMLMNKGLAGLFKPTDNDVRVDYQPE